MQLVLLVCTQNSLMSVITVVHRGSTVPCQQMPVGQVPICFQIWIRRTLWFSFFLFSKIMLIIILCSCVCMWKSGQLVEVRYLHLWDLLIEPRLSVLAAGTSACCAIQPTYFSFFSSRAVNLMGLGYCIKCTQSQVWQLFSDKS